MKAQKRYNKKLNIIMIKENNSQEWEADLKTVTAKNPVPKRNTKNKTHID